MQCPNCHHKLRGYSVDCPVCHKVLVSVEAQLQGTPLTEDDWQLEEEFDDHLMEAIMTSCLICVFGILALPFGILAIIKAFEANSKHAEGNLDGAKAAAAAAARWIKFTVWGCVVTWTLLICSTLYLSSRPN